MSVVTFHLPVTLARADRCESLLREASVVCAAVLGAPVERVRAFVQRYEPHLMAVGGRPLSDGGHGGVYFTCLVLEERPPQQRQELLARLTDLVGQVVGVPREYVRGHVVQVSPEDWAIGGIPVSVLREPEIRDREERG